MFISMVFGAVHSMVYLLVGIIIGDSMASIIGVLTIGDSIIGFLHGIDFTLVLDLVGILSTLMALVITITTIIGLIIIGQEIIIDETIITTGLLKEDK